MTTYQSASEVEREHELDTLARLLNERWRPIPPPPDPRTERIANVMRLIANVMEDALA